ncbi:hypothetical protein ACFSE0_06870 [Ochrobactrum teleogrylli]|uniref:Uncharacterized protein n=1 Tax=Ochrobactrum teleogrylli TaxID=2479765 RepID=A0ABY2Y2B8_9HYPH|nr:hypothetical protein [[Ochrobactrum] teleogrylli]TNV13124.1 hypothetical protein FIC94_15350 [[Ochrobactrum] teleogrylli]
MPKYTIKSLLTGEYLTLQKTIGGGLFLVNMSKDLDRKKSVWEFTDDVYLFSQPISIILWEKEIRNILSLNALKGESNIDGLYVYQCIAQSDDNGNPMLFNFIKFDGEKELYYIEKLGGGRLVVFEPKPGDTSYTNIYLENKDTPDHPGREGEKFIVAKYQDL